MGKIRNKSDQERVVLNRVVAPDEIVEVPDEVVYSYTCQSIWDPVGKADQTLHDSGAREENKRVKAEARG